ncbi:retinal rod rhodopsin-sensitive cGMP 3',5'-cyclic phosphodiesterase subunit delta-like protein [Catenaria anguillulae PL171]|uniref:Retinal rod rhodopsin-sensitive cGMP 3',5'-cyclic phosphodiesterase subunit delta-like protein n=1 Tax=Catenaria anguillulae PL171 TaxID=765915 RepID=A0A1Y2HW39_9FUNG|nr:retinal rod rhodopsin-sensitive cGMP 3',5'-cyclic phosphodiesterase subunit delta-like protein [Catenaria anguillulae PL171]
MPTATSNVRVNSITLKNPKNGKVIWQGDDWADAFHGEVKASIPKLVLTQPAVAREINFTNLLPAPIQHLRLVQNVYMNDELVEETEYEFGFVIPMSTNSWESVIESEGAGKEMVAMIVKSKVVLETVFYDGERELSKCRVQLCYV